MTPTAKEILRTHKPNKEGLYPVYILTYLKEKRSRISTKIYLKETQWAKGQVISHPDYKNLNRKIRLLITKAESKEMAAPSIPTFIDYARKVLQLQNNKLEGKTIEKYESKIKVLEGYDPKIKINQINFEWLEALKHWLRKDRVGNTVWDYFKLIRKILLNAKSKDLVKHNPFSNYPFPEYKAPTYLPLIFNSKLTMRRNFVIVILLTILYSCKPNPIKVITDSTKRPVMLVMLGESNAGGQVSINDLSSSDKEETQQVRTLDVVNYTCFQPLHIGVNNNLDHYNLKPRINVGWHTQIASRAKNQKGTLFPYYLVEGGQGGSTVSQWTPNSTFYKKLITRIDTAIYYVKAETGKPLPDIHFLYSQGINDAITGTPATQYKAGAVDLINRIRSRYGNAPVYITELPDNFHPSAGEYNRVITEIAKELPNVHLIETTDAPLQDQYHWSYEGMKIIANRMMNKVMK